MKLFGKSLEHLFKSEKEIIEEGSLKPIETIQDLESLYLELGEAEGVYSDRYKNLIDLDEQEQYDYWENASDPVKNRTTDVHEAGNLAGDDETVSLDDWGLNEIMEGGKTQRKIDAKYAELGDYVPAIKNENPHTAPEDLTKEERDEANSLRRTSNKILKKFHKKGKLLGQESEKVSMDNTPINLPVEAIIEQEQVKPEVKVVLEKKEKTPDELDRFKLMKEVIVYKRLVKENPDLDAMRPKRGDKFLSEEEIFAEIDRIGEKMREDEGSVTKLEREFFKQCKAWNWAQIEIEKYKRQGTIHGGVADMSPDEIQKLQDEYYNLKNNNPKQFAKLNLEFIGEKKVEAGEWKKAQFAWESEVHQGRTQWVCKIGKTKYVTSTDPTDVALIGQEADFFYVEGKAFPLHNGDTLQFINIRIPFVDQGSKMGNKKVSVS